MSKKEQRRKNTASSELPDDETEEILEEMRQAGELEDGDGDESEEEEDEDADESGDDDDADDDDDGDDEEEEKPAKKKSAKKPKAGDAGDEDDAEDDDADEDEDDEDDDANDDDEDVELKGGKKRKPQFVPLSKHQKKINNLKSRHDEEVKGYEKRIADLTKAAGKGEDVDDEVKALAKEHGIPEDSLSKIVELTAKKLSGAGLTDSQKRQLARLEKDEESRVQDEGFQKEFKSLVKEDRSIREHEDELREMAFSEEFSDVGLYEIFHRHLKPTLQPKKKTAEGSRGGTRSNSTSYTDEEIAADAALQEALSDEEFDAWSDRMASKSKRQIRRNGKPIKRS